jgi:hypothetical protein
MSDANDDDSESVQNAAISKHQLEAIDEKARSDASKMLKDAVAGIQTRLVVAHVVLMPVLVGLVFVYSYCLHLHADIDKEISAPMMWAITFLVIVILATTQLDRTKYASSKYIIYQRIRTAALAICIGVYGFFSVMVLMGQIAGNSVATNSPVVYRVAAATVYAVFVVLVVTGVFYWTVHTRLSSVAIPDWISHTLAKEPLDALEQGSARKQSAMNSKAHHMDRYAPSLLANSPPEIRSALIRRLDPHIVDESNRLIQNYSMRMQPPYGMPYHNMYMHPYAVPPTQTGYLPGMSSENVRYRS